VKNIGLEVSEVKIGIKTNSPHLLEKDRFFWLDTNFLSVDKVPFEEAKDSLVKVWDNIGGTPLEIKRNTLCLRGNFSELEKEANDPRYSIFGNLGIFSSWVLRVLEETQNIYTLHACGLVKRNKLIIIPGGAGAGKSVFILSALRKGWKIFSTEFVHFRVKGGIEFFKGSLKDTVRVDTLKCYFQDVAEELGISLKAEIGGKMVVDLSLFQTDKYQIRPSDVILIFPHVEERRDRIICEELKDREILLRKLFNNASDKIGKSILLYSKLAVPGLDSVRLGQRRKENLEKFLQSGKVKKSLLWISGVKEAREIFDRININEFN